MLPWMQVTKGGQGRPEAESGQGNRCVREILVYSAVVRAFREIRGAIHSRSTNRRRGIESMRPTGALPSQLDWEGLQTAGRLPTEAPFNPCSAFKQRYRVTAGPLPAGSVPIHSWRQKVLQVRWGSESGSEHPQKVS
jgi:hypothetical protein